jgi:hypothetical protein
MIKLLENKNVLDYLSKHKDTGIYTKKLGYEAKSLKEVEENDCKWWWKEVQKFKSPL